jgi:signal transduction histidine kinase
MQLLMRVISDPKRKRQLILLGHLWACVPVLVLWLAIPSANTRISTPNFHNVTYFAIGIIGYLAMRSWLVLTRPNLVQWDFVFPPIDIAIVSFLIWLGRLDPLSNVGLLYLFPIAQAAGTLNLRWSFVVAGMVLLGAAISTRGLASPEPFNTFFRYFFIFVFGSLITLLALSSAEIREQLGVARDRNRLAMEIHDGIQGHLMTITKQLELASQLTKRSPARCVELLLEGQESSRLAADELRYIVNRMRSATLSGGFVPALKSYIHTACARQSLAYSFDVTGEERPLPVEVEHAAFRIAQEALTNVIRHSKSKTVSIRVSYLDKDLELRIADDGVGFNAELASDGLEGMKLRALERGGHLAIDSGSHGTLVAVRLSSGGANG